MPKKKKMLCNQCQDLILSRPRGDGLKCPVVVGSFNEMPVKMIDPEIGRWIKVIKPSRTSLTCERME